jgi:hypothetical protein
VSESAQIGTLTLRRDHGLAGRWHSWSVEIDGTRVGALASGERLSWELDAGTHMVTVNGARCEVHIVRGQFVELRAAPRMGRSSTNAPGWSPGPSTLMIERWGPTRTTM